MSATTRGRCTSASAAVGASSSTAPRCSAGLERAAIKRPVEREQLEALVDRIVAELRARGGTPGVEEVGELALRGLRELDAVAYVRFASVYRKFEDVEEFERELERLDREPPLQHEHLFEPARDERAEVCARPGPSEPDVSLQCYPLRPEIRAHESTFAGFDRGKFRELEE